MAPMGLISMSATRWGGYLDAMLRYLKIEDRLAGWVESRPQGIDVDGVFEHMLGEVEK